MAQIKQLKDVVTNQEFYPVTHKDAIIGLEGFTPDLSEYATKQWVEDKGYLTEHQDISGKVDVADFEEATLVTSAALNHLNELLSQKSQEIQTLQNQVIDLQNQVSTLMEHYNELENTIV